MGGGTRGSTRTSNSARETINRTISNYDSKGEVAKPKRNVFTSFHMADEFAKQLLVMQAKNDKFDLEFSNYAIDEPFDEKWKTQCKSKISLVSKVIVLIGKETHQREAVKWEIDEAYRQGKEVIGVRIHRYENHTVPQALIDNGAKIIDWDLDKISKELGKE